LDVDNKSDPNTGKQALARNLLRREKEVSQTKQQTAENREQRADNQQDTNSRILVKSNYRNSLLRTLFRVKMRAQSGVRVALQTSSWTITAVSAECFEPKQSVEFAEVSTLRC
jgi:hypothetical protein